MTAAALGLDCSSSPYATTCLGSVGSRDASDVSANTADTVNTPAGRLRTRTFGVSLGGFGFTYTSRDLEFPTDAADALDTLDVDPDAGNADDGSPSGIASAADATDSAALPGSRAAFLDELDTALLRQSLAETSRRAPGNTLFVRGAAAYARMATSYAEPAAGSLLAVA